MPVSDYFRPLCLALPFLGFEVVVEFIEVVGVAMKDYVAVLRVDFFSDGNICAAGYDGWDPNAWESFGHVVTLYAPCNVVDVAPGVGADEVGVDGNEEVVPYTLRMIRVRRLRIGRIVPMICCGASATTLRVRSARCPLCR